MKKRIAIGAALALVASLAFATIASASDEFADGGHTVTLPGSLGTVSFQAVDGAVIPASLVLPAGFELVDDDDDSDDMDEIEITNGQVVVEIEPDDDAPDGISVEVESLNDDDDSASDDDASSDDDAMSEDEDSVSGDDADSEDSTEDARSEDDDSVSGDDADSEDEVSTTPTSQVDDDDSLSGEDDDSLSGEDDDSEDDDSN